MPTDRKRRDRPDEIWGELHARPPPLLYHYTTAAGLLSMLNTGRVWASEANHLNDPREFVHGTGVFSAALRARLERGAPRVIRQLAESVERNIEERKEDMRIFCFSFCADGDLLSQWRGYGDVGGGYALGFKSNLLFGRVVHERPPLRVLRRVIYGNELQRQLVDQWLDAIEAGGTPSVLSKFWYFFSEASVSFKDQAYSEEGEWRLIQFGRVWSKRPPWATWTYPVSFRERRGRLVPYAELDLSRSRGVFAGRLPVAEIVDGPTQHMERSGKALRLLLESRGYGPNHVHVRRSVVPFLG